ncbi:AAA family ATPase [Kocuria rosea]|uniref:AAA family ATPase n=1 Tax=Kocuria rosea TaxID=1275 RepID=UPI0023304B7D|nr:AAA family ATPase [Kocuria rosea]
MTPDNEAQKRLIVTPASRIRPRRQKWLWAPGGAGVIPLGTGTICAGKGGEGKSTFMLDIAGQLTRGELPGDLHGTPGSVIIMGPEDDWDTIMVPRLIAAGADLDHVYSVAVETITDTLTQQRELRFPLDTTELEQAVEETGARLVIIDPAPALMSGDMNKVQDVRNAYGPLMALAQRRELSMTLINHFGKGAGTVTNKLSGSHAWRDVTRSYLAFAADEESGERIVTQDKNNYGTGTGSYKFTLESMDVATDDGPTSVGRVRFLGESDVTVAELISREHRDADDEDDRNAAQAFLLDYLRSQPGHEGNAGDALKAGTAVGFSRDEMKKARSRCRDPRILSEKSRDFNGGWVWRVEEEGATEGAVCSGSGTLGTLGVAPAQIEGITAGRDEGATDPGEGATEAPKVPKVPKVPTHGSAAPSLAPCVHALPHGECFQCQFEGQDAA